MNFTGSWVLTFIAVGVVLLFGVGFLADFEVAGAIIAVYVVGGIGYGIGYNRGANRHR